jgi:hypothetical protein
VDLYKVHAACQIADVKHLLSSEKSVSCYTVNSDSPASVRATALDLNVSKEFVSAFNQRLFGSRMWIRQSSSITYGGIGGGWWRSSGSWHTDTAMGWGNGDARITVWRHSMAYHFPLSVVRTLNAAEQRAANLCGK